MIILYIILIIKSIEKVNYFDYILKQIVDFITKKIYNGRKEREEKR